MTVTTLKSEQSPSTLIAAFPEALIVALLPKSTFPVTCSVPPSSKFIGLLKPASPSIVRTEFSPVTVTTLKSAQSPSTLIAAFPEALIVALPPKPAFPVTCSVPPSLKFIGLLKLTSPSNVKTESSPVTVTALYGAQDPSILIVPLPNALTVVVSRLVASPVTRNTESPLKVRPPVKLASPFTVKTGPLPFNITLPIVPPLFAIIFAPGPVALIIGLDIN